jgi:hypothetical protein
MIIELRGAARFWMKLWYELGRHSNMRSVLFTGGIALSGESTGWSRSA